MEETQKVYKKKKKKKKKKKRLKSQIVQNNVQIPVVHLFQVTKAKQKTVQVYN